MSWTSKNQIKSALNELNELQKIIEVRSFKEKMGFAPEYFPVSRAILQMKHAVAYLGEKTDVMRQIDHDLDVLDATELVEKEKKVAASASVVVKQDNMALLAAKRREKYADADKNGPVCDIETADVLCRNPDGSIVYQDQYKPAINSYIEDSIGALNVSMSALDALKSTSERLKDRMQQCHSHLSKLSTFVERINTNLQKAVLAAQLLQLRNQLSTIVSNTNAPLVSAQTVEEEEEKESVSALAVPSPSPSSPQAAVECINPIFIESTTLAKTIASHVLASKTRLHDLTDANDRLQAAQSGQVGQGSLQQLEIDRLNSRVSELEQAAGSFAIKSERFESNNSAMQAQVDQASKTLESNKREMQGQIDQVNAVNQDLNHQLEQHRIALADLKIANAKGSWIKWFGISAAVVIGLGLMATGVGMLAGLGFLAGASFMASAAVAATGLTLMVAGGGLGVKHHQMAQHIDAVADAMKKPIVVAPAYDDFAEADEHKEEKHQDLAGAQDVAIQIPQGIVVPSVSGSASEDVAEQKGNPQQDDSPSRARSNSIGSYSAALNMFQPAGTGVIQRMGSGLTPGESPVQALPLNPGVITPLSRL
jgi:predicted  nucleic acid-binding Zn-ribbon protein